MTDGDFDTHVIVKTTTVIERGDYGLTFQQTAQDSYARFATGTKTADNYTFGNAVVNIK